MQGIGFKNMHIKKSVDGEFMIMPKLIRYKYKKGKRGAMYICISNDITLQK